MILDQELLHGASRQPIRGSISMWT